MKTLKIYGASDDLVETSGIDGCDEFGVYNSDSRYMCELTVHSADGEITVHAIYTGSWAFAITTEMGDCDQMPDWPVRRTWGKDSSYSETLEIDVPDDAVLKGPIEK